MGLENMWVNFGRTQVHLPSRAVPPRPKCCAAPWLRRAEPRGSPETPRVRRRGDEAGRARSENQVLVGEGTASKRPARGATACAATPSPVRQHRARPVYVGVRRATGHRRRDCALLPRSDESTFEGGKEPRHRRHRTQPISVLHRNEEAAAGVRQPSHPDLHRRLRHAVPG